MSVPHEALPPWVRSAEGFVMASKKIDYDVEHVEPGGVVWASDIEEERLRWLWRGRIPVGKVTFLDGDPGLGKSTLTLDLAARHSRGRPFPFEPDDNYGRGVTLIVSGEDDFSDTIKPRLRAAGADDSRIAFLALREDKTGEALPFSVPDDIPRLKNALGETEATLVIIDPISAFISEHVHTHNDASVRKAMMPLVSVAQERQCAILALRHLTKDDSVTKALYRGGGSIGFAGSARSVLLAAPKPDDDGIRVLAQTKANLAKPGDNLSLEWRVVSWDDDPEIALVKWLGPSDLRADDLLRRYDGRRDDPVQREAVAFLKTELAKGPKLSKEIKAAARELGITARTLDRARRRLKVHACPLRSRRSRTGQVDVWVMHLQDHPCPSKRSDVRRDRRKR